jgi:hypothetical protein
VHGGDKVLLWRVVPGRPAGLKHPTLKRRLSQLQKDGQLGGTVGAIEAASLRLHALLQQRDAEVAAEKEAEAAAAAAAAAQEGGERAAAAPPLGSKRKADALAQPSSPRSKRARAADAAAASAAAQVAAAGAAPEEGAAAARGLLVALLPSVLRREVHEGRLPKASAALDELAALVERVVASAPKQHKEKAAGRGGGAAAKRRPGPQPLSALQQHQVRVGGGLLVAARPGSLLKRWAAALRGVGARGGEGEAAGAAAAGAAAALEQPSPSVTAALALIQLLLFSATSGVLGEGVGERSECLVWRSGGSRACLLPAALRCQAQPPLPSRSCHAFFPPRPKALATRPR